LVPQRGDRQRRRLLLTIVATLVIGVTATQSRAGLVSACAVLMVAWLLSRYGVRMVLYMIGTVALALVFAWSIDLRMTTDRREISVTQLVQNIGSLSGDNSSDLGSTVKWRDDLWNSVLDRTREEKKLPAGWGFGPNLAEEMGFEGDAAQPLRSPHNSHIDVLARMGLIGAGLWIALWLSWFTLLVRTRRRMSGPRNLRRGLIDMSMAGVVGMLVNAYFDPSLESPQVALWLWTLFGLGIGLAMARDEGTADSALMTAAPAPPL
jgi:O-antigen ligase